MDQCMLDQVERVIRGEITGGAAKIVLEEARKVVDTRQRAFLAALNHVLAAERALAAGSVTHNSQHEAVSG